MQDDPFDVPVASILTKQAMHPVCSFPAGQVFTGHGFYSWLNARPDTKLWVLVYSAKPHDFLEVPVERLLTIHGTYPAKETRVLLGIHTKLYLQFESRKLIGAYSGSLNLVAPTTANLMFNVTAYADHLKEYFLFYWKQAIKTCTPSP